MKQGKPWYRIDAKAGDRAEIFIYDDVGADWFGEGLTAKSFIADLDKVKAKDIDVRINSGGGSVFEGLAIYNALRRKDARVVTHVDGLAASIASVIALAGVEVHMARAAFMMVHQPFAFAMGNAKELRAAADTLETVGGTLREIYVAKSGKPVDDVTAWMDAETWFTASAAEEAGLIDEITEEPADLAIAASLDPKRFHNLPAALTRAARGGPAELTPDQLRLMHFEQESLRRLAASVQRRP